MEIKSIELKNHRIIPNPLSLCGETEYLDVEIKYANWLGITKKTEIIEVFRDFLTWHRLDNGEHISRFDNNELHKQIAKALSKRENGQLEKKIRTLQEQHRQENMRVAKQARTALETKGE